MEKRLDIVGLENVRGPIYVLVQVRGAVESRLLLRYGRHRRRAGNKPRQAFTDCGGNLTRLRLLSIGDRYAGEENKKRY